MTLRFYLLLRAYLMAAFAIIAAILPLFVKADTFGLCFAIGFSALTASLSFFYFRAAGKARGQERAFAPPIDANIAQQIDYFKKTLIFGSIGFFILTIITAASLNSLESGGRETVMLLGPVRTLYESQGYWVAVLSVPVLGLATSGALFWKLRKLDEESRKSA